jgi:hypothetical protein
VIASVRPNAWDLPLFLHVTGAILLVGVLAAVLALALAGSRRPDASILSDSTFWVVLCGSLPAWLLMRVAAQWIYSKEHFSGHNDPTWLGIGFGVSDLGILILLVLLGISFRWRRKAVSWAPRLIVGVTALYLVLLTVAMLAMSGKWA